MIMLGPKGDIVLEGRIIGTGEDKDLSITKLEMTDWFCRALKCIPDESKAVYK